MKKRKGLSVTTYTSKLGLHHVYKLYDTNILLFEENSVRLNSDGFKTNHTKNCMNDNLPDGYRVYQSDFKWFVKTPTRTLSFQDNMVIKF